MAVLTPGFAEPGEASRILRKLADWLEDATEASGPIKDVNGNTVGEYWLPSTKTRTTMTKPTNEERAERAYRVLLVYLQRIGEQGEPTQQAAINLMTDLAHLYDQYSSGKAGLSALSMAMNHYTTKKDGQQ